MTDIAYAVYSAEIYETPHLSCVFLDKTKAEEYVIMQNELYKEVSFYFHWEETELIK